MSESKLGDRRFVALAMLLILGRALVHFLVPPALRLCPRYSVKRTTSLSYFWGTPIDLSSTHLSSPTFLHLPRWQMDERTDFLAL